MKITKHENGRSIVINTNLCHKQALLKLNAVKTLHQELGDNVVYMQTKSGSFMNCVGKYNKVSYAVEVENV